MKKFRGKRAVITGAASGIGRALAVALSRHGANLELVDRDAQGLAQTAALAQRDGIVANTHVVDVGDSSAMGSLSAAVDTHGGADLVINNAGVGLYGSVMEMSNEEFAWLMNVNFWGVVNGVRAFLPQLLLRPEACIVNVSSLFGLWAPPGQAAYAASKFAVRGYSEALRAELAGTNVAVFTVHPAGVATAIAKRSRIAAAADQARAASESEKFDRRFLTMPPERAAEIILNGIQRNHGRILVGKEAHRVELLLRILGSRAATLLNRRVPFDSRRNGKTDA